MNSRPVSVNNGIVECLEKAKKSLPDDFHHQMGWALKALQNAFFQLLHAESLEAGIIDTVRQGGDTDTNGCIAGALLGSVHGDVAIPDRWVATLLDCRSPRASEYHCNDLSQLAHNLLKGTT